MEFNNLNQRDLDELTKRDDDLYIDLTEGEPVYKDGFEVVEPEKTKKVMAMTIEEIKKELWWARFYGHTTIKLNSSREVLQAELTRIRQSGVEIHKFFILD